MIVILGGGFAGVSAYNQNSEAVVVDKKDFFLLTPWVIDYVCGLKELEDVTVKYKRVVLGELRKIDYKGKRVILDKDREIRYDKLIVSLGHHQNLPRLKGAREYAHKIETLDDAVALRKRLEEVKNVVIVGGGATGVELAGNIRGKNITLIHRKERLLPTMTTGSSKRAEKLLTELGVNLMLKVSAEEITKEGVVTSNGFVKSELTIFAGGLKGPQIIDTIEHRNKDHRLLVDKYLRSVEFNDIYGAGDCATFENEDIPMSANTAVISGRVAMRNAMGEEVEFRPKRLATILRVGEDFFGDFGDNYVEGNSARLLRSIAYTESLMLPEKLRR
ncbi:pyridine nucleotide-disulfide oxidoreductase [Sulfolobus acidocaldarius]|uniref:Pyridine nucleotide-disulphide oxidoreductase n=4 Tax=Sulfolobus acidocaldarius TaxID=2285 RepID=Q4J7J4_SULAC|nr:pyridine nucleotide-disulphide oxidoreductase [Sulfolobus acidocaldarius DSM 639]AGE71866.1 pyridine nucleotide-disulfide oxidoreductase [Sulfolobus acidocaldarius N8]AGE74138.1 pyridine nucleotide-disulfide oxidoreductase [Sulfolobus acidocaldarius Ron12/I]ALU29955.1 pyridine nucleotide-disulfide oxidoreductase [Sulfolobus acidocaldarius]ALU32886.1 pyridine nucleotide-disulfide oxidoreductase [Sulfolobus acidocaldarius]